MENGETFRIVRHGKIIAHISPPRKKQPSWKTSGLNLTISGVSLSEAILKKRSES